ncbi:MAG: SH3 domain-containing protein [Ruminococcus sp.]|nr:SH3 domain-containing protein [Ruminococcus sp.]
MVTNNFICNTIAFDDNHYPVEWECSHNGNKITVLQYETECKKLTDSYLLPEYYEAKEVIKMLSAGYIPPQSNVLNYEEKLGMVTTQEGQLNIRCGPSVDFGVLGQVWKSDVVTIIGETDDWYIIKCGTPPYANQVGCVHKDYISVD